MNDFNIKRADFSLSIISQILRSDLCIPFKSSFLSKIDFFKQVLTYFSKTRNIETVNLFIFVCNLQDTNYDAQRRLSPQISR